MAAERWDYALMRRRLRFEICMHQRSIYASRRAADRLILYGREHFLPTGCSITEARKEGVSMRPADISENDWAEEVDEEMVRLQELHDDMDRDRAAIEKLKEDLKALKGMH